MAILAKRLRTTARDALESWKGEYLLLGSIVLLAGVLRLYRLGAWSFWIDEIITVNAAHEVFGEGLLPTALSGRGLSLYLIGLAMKLWGTSEWTARIIPALIGVVTIVILYFPTRRITNRFVALVTMALLAVTPFHLYYSQTARYVSSLMLFYALALLFLFLALEENRKSFLLISLAFFIVAMWERLYAITFLPSAIGYVVLVSFWPGVRRPPGLKARTLVPYFVTATIIGALFLTSLLNKGPSAPVTALYDVGQDGPLGHLLHFAYEITIPLAVMALASAIVLLLVKPTRIALFAALAAAGPIGSIAALSLFVTVDVRYMIGGLVFVLLLIACAISRLWYAVPNETKVIVAVVGLALAGDGLLTDLWYYNPQNARWPDWRFAYNMVEEQRATSSIILSNKPQLGQYYLDDEVGNLMSLEPISVAVNGGVEEVWIVADKGQRYIDPNVQQWIKTSAEIAHDAPKYTIYRYRRPQDQ